MILCGDDPDAMVLAFLLNIKTGLHGTRRFPLVHGYNMVKRRKDDDVSQKKGPWN
jgi:hypothetical protein